MISFRFSPTLESTRGRGGGYQRQGVHYPMGEPEITETLLTEPPLN